MKTVSKAVWVLPPSQPASAASQSKICCGDSLNASDKGMRPRRMASDSICWEADHAQEDAQRSWSLTEVVYTPVQSTDVLDDDVGWTVMAFCFSIRVFFVSASAGTNPMNIFANSSCV